MGKFRGVDSDPGWINRKFAEHDRMLREDRAAKRLRASTFAAGSIPQSALQSPSAPGAVSLPTSNFALTTTGANLIDSTVTVPNGFTSCVINLTGRVFAYNSTAAVDYLYARTVVNGLAATAVPIRTNVSDAAANLSPLATVLTGLVGGNTFPVQLWAKSSTADWAANTSNTAELTGSIVWFS